MTGFIVKKKTAILPVLLLALSVTGCGTGKKQVPDNPIDRTGFYFDTYINIKIYDSDDETILDACMEEAARFERLFSATRTNSDVWNINHAAGKAVTVDDDTAELIETALSYAERTDGIFEPSIGAVSSLWNFTEEPKGPVPDRTFIAEGLTHVDYETIQLDGNNVSLSDPEAQIDLGAIAKGFIADKMKELLLAKGVNSAIINLGGNVLTVGKKPDGTSFKIGVQKPFDVRNETIEIVEVNDLSMVSSGNYERYFEEDGELYHHILDPATGFPVTGDLLGVTILSRYSVDGDALSTSCFILGLDKGMALMEETADTEALFITGDRLDPDSYEIHYTSGFPRKE